nr:reverse transcriptase domain-containing protein [Tanacetum cinerariifolium]
MSTRSSAKNLFPPLDTLELTIRRTSRADPTLLKDFEMAAEGNGDIPVPDLWTMEELCQPSLSGRGGTFMKRRPEECYDLIENMTAHHNDWDTSAQRTIVGQTQNVYAARAYQVNTITNPKEDLKGITTRIGTAYQGPTIPTTSCSSLVERETEATKDTVHPANNESTEDVQPLVVLTESLILTSEPVVTSIIEPAASPVSALKPNLRPLIPYPSRLQDQKLRDKANDQREKFFQIFKDLNFNIGFADAFILMPKFSPSIKSLLTNKDKLCDLA